MRWPHRYKVYNVLHKSVVSVLMGITFLATFMTGVHGVHYFRGETNTLYIVKLIIKTQNEP